MRALIVCVWLIASVAIPPAQQRPRYAARIEAVRVNVLVTDRGRPVSGLTAKDFAVRDEGVAQAIERVEVEHLPLDLIIALDSSASGRDGLGGGRGALSYSKAAAHAALKPLRPGDRAALVTFSHHIQLQSALTTDRDAIERAIERARPLGSTALCDGIVSALLVAPAESERRTLLLVYTDGIDNISWLEPQDVIDAAGRTDIVVSVVTPRKDARFRATSRLGKHRSMSHFLGDLTSTTGGSLIASESDHLEQTFARIVSEFTQAYQLVYYPTGPGKAGWHSLTVTLKHKRGNVHARRGYYVD